MRANRFSAIILAGGRSSRMGQAKAALSFGATTIIDRLIRELLGQSDEVRFDEILVVAAPLAEERFPANELLRPWLGQIRLLRDEAAFAGPVPALIQGLSAARNPIAFACSCDLPSLRASVAHGLCEMIGNFDAAVPMIAGRSQPLCAAYRCNVAKEIEGIARTGESRLSSIVDQLNLRRVREAELRRIDPDLRSFLNLNTREDYERALAIAELKS
jgi:molybdenum cofactor guanylyltransferase